MPLKTWLLFLYLYSNYRPELIYISQLVLQQQTVARDFKSSNRNATGLSKCDKYRNYWVLFNASWICLGFALDLLYIDLLDTDLPDAD